MGGIYKITSPSGRVYIGQSINPVARYYQHKSNLASRSHHSITLQEEVDLHGLESLEFEIIEEVDSDINLLSSRENYWIEFYKNKGKIHNRIVQVNSDSPEQKRKLTLWASLEVINTLKQLASDLGFVQDRGPAKGQGSISAMIEALAQGQLTITRKEPEHDK